MILKYKSYIHYSQLSLLLPKLTSVFISLICAIKTASSENFLTYFCISCPLLFLILLLLLLSSCPAVRLSFICRFAFISNIWRHILQIIFACIFARDSSKTSAEKLSKKRRKIVEKTYEVFFCLLLVFLVIFMGQEKSTIQKADKMSARRQRSFLGSLRVSKLCTERTVRGGRKGREEQEGKAERRKCCR